MAGVREQRPSWRPPVLSASEERVWAREVALHAHAGQLDKAGEPYIRHCQRVAEAVDGDKAKSVAFLHDVVEKAPGWTSERLLDSGFSPEVVAAVESLTHRTGETKDALTIRAASNALAAVVKRADLLDNLSQVERQGKDGTQYRRRLVLLDAAAAYDGHGAESESADRKIAASSARGEAGEIRREAADRVAKRLALLLGMAAAALIYLVLRF